MGTPGLQLYLLSLSICMNPLLFSVLFTWSGVVTSSGIPSLFRTPGTFNKSIWPIENMDDVSQYINNPCVRVCVCVCVRVNERHIYISHQHM